MSPTHEPVAASEAVAETEAPSESKIALTERLRREGRWEVASRFKDAEVLRLRSEQGLTRKAAQQAAWAAMAREFPPEASHAPAASEDQGADLLDPDEDLTQSAQPQQLAADVLWVYAALAMSQVTSSQAPTRGAWALYRWARDNQQRFFEAILPKVMNAKLAEQATASAVEDPGIEDCVRLLASVTDAMHVGLLQAPENLHASAERCLAQWQAKSQVQLDEQQRRALLNAVDGLITRVLDAAIAHPQLAAARRRHRVEMGE
jgi:hypothetical protein